MVRDNALALRLASRSPGMISGLFKEFMTGTNDLDSSRGESLAQE